MKRFEIAILIGIVASILISSIMTFADQCAEVREQVVRLHVLANSDSDEDQALKLAVRDAVLEGTAEIFTQSGGKLQIEGLVLNNLEGIEALALAEMQSQGYDYQVQASVVNMYFETRVYDGITLPAGYYDAVRIVIGEGRGKNWWCVMYPPMCIPAATGEEGEALEEQIVRLGAHPQYEPKFAVVELWESLTSTLGGRQDQPVDLPVKA